MNEPLSPIVPVAFGALTAGSLLVSRAGTLVGWAVIEATGTTPAEIDFFDGRDSGGELLAPIALSGGQSTRDAPPFPGLSFQVGLFASIVSGSVRGVAWVVLS